MDKCIFCGDIKAVCRRLKSLHARFKGWTLAEMLRYFLLTEAEKKQFGIDREIKTLDLLSNVSNLQGNNSEKRDSAT